MMKYTVTLEYTSEKQKQNLMEMFINRAGYTQVTNDYIENEKLQKGIFLKYGPVE